MAVEVTEDKATIAVNERIGQSLETTADDVATRKEDGEYGSVAGWLTVLGSWIMQFNGFGYINSYGVYQDFYVREYLSNFTASQVSWIGSTQLFITMGAGICTGALFDMGYFNHLVLSGALIQVASLFLLSLAQPQHYYQIFLTQAIMSGLGIGLIYIPSLAVIAQHFRSPSRRALTMCVVASGASLGGVVHPIMLNQLFHNTSLGFHSSVKASAGLVAGMNIVACLLMKGKYGETASGRIKFGVFKAANAFAKDPAYVVLVLGSTIYVLGTFFPIFYIQLDAVMHGLSPTFAFYTVTILNGASLFGRILAGLPGLLRASPPDRPRGKYPLLQLDVPSMVVLSSAGCTLFVFTMIGVKNVAGFIALAIFFGGFNGAYVALLSPMIALLARHPNEIGTRMGICFFFIGLGCLMGPPINGALLTSQFAWWKPALFSGLMATLATLLFATSSVIMSRRAITDVRGK